MCLKCILGLGNVSRLLVVSVDLEISISYHISEQKRLFFLFEQWLIISFVESLLAVRWLFQLSCRITLLKLFSLMP